MIAGAILVSPVAPGTAASATIAAPAAAPRPITTRWPLCCGGRLTRAGLSGAALGCRSAYRLFCHLKLQSALARAFGDGLHATMVTITRPIEDHPADSGGL